ncbi:PKD repeat protein [Methanofollis sp. W23]|uniref:PKD domain-containing protein n=1 Tax=Methanofollis sp. W23 TaxID=2817849 RepID=UPI001D60400C|nr:PKD domain-containing protein [Methanofollis sp. W23]MBP2145088.1 PKD repeat protein [Methanofollis sp. W23]
MMRSISAAGRSRPGKYRPAAAVVIVIVALLALTGIAAGVEIPEERWRTTYDSGYNDYGYALQMTNESDFVLAGKVQNGSTSDMLLLKTDRNGTLLWNQTYDYAGYDTAHAVKETPDGGYILGGFGLIDMTYASIDGAMMVRTDENGSVLWTGPTGNVSPTWEAVQDVAVCEDGGFVLTGRDNPSAAPNAAYLVKTNETGGVEWTNGYMRDIDDTGFSVLQTDEGDYVFAGISADIINGTTDAFLRKADANGTLIWERYYPASEMNWTSQGAEGDFWTVKAVPTADGGYAVAGRVVFEKPDTAAAALIKTDAEGQVEWSRAYTSCSDTFWAEDLVERPEGGFILACHCDPPANPQNAISLIATDDTGEIEWRDFYTIGPFENDPHAIVATGDGGYAIGGEAGICENPADITNCTLDAFILRLGPREPPAPGPGPAPQPSLNADFKAFPRSGVAPLEVAFTDLSTGSPTSWAWDFGDGTGSTAQFPTHTYTKPGTYTVSLTISDGTSADTERKVGYITVSAEELKANLSFVPREAEVTEGENTTYDVVMDRAEEGIAFYYMDIDLTDPAVAEIVDVEMPAWVKSGPLVSPLPADSVQLSGIKGVTDPGKENITLCTLTVRGDLEGQTDLAVGEARVLSPVLNEYLLTAGTGSLNVTPSDFDANFTADPLNGTAPLEVNFTDTSVGSPTAWFWEFGDGDTSTEQNPAHEYAEPGLYTVILTISDGTKTDAETKADYIEVTAAPSVLAANFTADPLNGTAPLEVSFTDLSEGPVTSWFWEFGDGDTSTEQNPTHEYAEPGLYSVVLTVSDGTETDAKVEADYINVTAAPSVLAANFTAEPRSGTTPLSVGFTDLSEGPVTSWFWEFGDGDTSTEQNPTHEYAEPGLYSVVLTVSDGTETDAKVEADYIEVTPEEESTPEEEEELTPEEEEEEVTPEEESTPEEDEEELTPEEEEAAPEETT